MDAVPVITDYFADRRVIAPFAADDPSLLIDVDFRDGQAAVEAILTPQGFTLDGSGHLWDSELGFNPNQVSGYSNGNWTPVGYASRAEAFAAEEVTVHIEVQRSAFSTTWLDDGDFFIDSIIGPSASCWDGETVTPANHLYGDYTAATKVGYGFRFVGPTGINNFGCAYQVSNNVGNPVARVYSYMHDGVVDEKISTRLTADVPSQLDQDFLAMTYSLKGNILRWHVDGHLARRFYMDSSFTTQDLMRRCGIGSQYTTTYPLNGYIRRFQVANKACDVVREGPRIAGIGDSFFQAGSGQDNPATTTVEGITTVQNTLYESSFNEAQDIRLNPIINTRSRPFLHELSRLAGNFALPLQIYCAGESGHGWAEEGTAGVLTPFSQAYLDAVVAYDPEIITGNGSTNDVKEFNPALDLLGDIQTKITYMISRCYNVRKFYFFECWPGYKGKDVHTTAGSIAEYHRQRVLQAQINGFTVANASGHDVVVEFVPTYENLGGDDYPARFNRGGGEIPLLWDALYTKTSSMTDLHPTQFGHNRIAEAYWDALKDNFIEIPAGQ